MTCKQSCEHVQKSVSGQLAGTSQSLGEEGGKMQSQGQGDAFRRRDGEGQTV